MRHPTDSADETQDDSQPPYAHGRLIPRQAGSIGISGLYCRHQAVLPRLPPVLVPSRGDRRAVRTRTPVEGAVNVRLRSSDMSRRKDKKAADKGSQFSPDASTLNEHGDSRPEGYGLRILHLHTFDHQHHGLRLNRARRIFKHGS